MLSLLLTLAPAWSPAAELPPQAGALLADMEKAERGLQDSSLELEAARREAQPAAASVAEARREEGRFLGRWRLNRALARLKEKLDRVESARVAQARARERLILLLNGLDEEVTAALEVPSSTGTARRYAWWEQKRAWQRRLESLDPWTAGSGGRQARGRRLEVRLAFLEREATLVESLLSQGVLEPYQAARERARLEALVKKARQEAPAGDGQ
jgi:hypothetical protein